MNPGGQAKREERRTAETESGSDLCSDVAVGLGCEWQTLAAGEGGGWMPGVFFQLGPLLKGWIR